VTVLSGECEGKLGRPHRARRLIGFDGMTIHMEPNVYKVEADIIRRIDGWMHPSASVWLPERSPTPSRSLGRRRRLPR
jgi:hypothetical protein